MDRVAALEARVLELETPAAPEIELRHVCPIHSQFEPCGVCAAPELDPTLPTKAEFDEMTRVVWDVDPVLRQAASAAAQDMAIPKRGPGRPKKEVN